MHMYTHIVVHGDRGASPNPLQTLSPGPKSIPKHQTRGLRTISGSTNFRRNNNEIVIYGPDVHPLRYSRPGLPGPGSTVVRKNPGIPKLLYVSQ